MTIFAGHIKEIKPQLYFVIRIHFELPTTASIFMIIIRQGIVVACQAARCRLQIRNLVFLCTRIGSWYWKQHQINSLITKEYWQIWVDCALHLGMDYSLKRTTVDISKPLCDKQGLQWLRNDVCHMTPCTHTIATSSPHSVSSFPQFSKLRLTVHFEK